MAEGQRVRAITVAAVMMGALAFGTSLLVLWLGRDVASQAEVQLASARRVEQIGEAGATFKAAPVARPVAGPSGPKFGSITVIIDKPGNFDNISVTCTSGYREQFRVGGGTVVASGIPVGDKCTADLKGRAESPDFPVRAGGRYTCTSGVNTRCSGG
jgi:hypothetical protein